MNAPQWFSSFINGIFPVSIYLLLIWALTFFMAGRFVHLKYWLLTTGIMATLLFPCLLPSIPSFDWKFWTDSSSVKAVEQIPLDPIAFDPDVLSAPDPVFNVSKESSNDILTYIYLVWLAGVSLSLSRLLAGYLSLKRWCRRQPVAMGDLATRFKNLLEEAGLKLHVTLKLTEKPIGPITMGIGHPEIVLPESLVKELSWKELELIMMHEFSHIRRRDNLWILLQRLTEAIYFFHPFIWCVSLALTRCREILCDDNVMTYHGNGVLYSKAIFRFLEFKVAAAYPAHFFSESFNDIKNRMDRILRKEYHMNASRLRTTAVSLVAVAIFICCLVTWGTNPGALRAQENNASQESSLRTVHIEITYDFAPPSDYQPYKVTLTDKATGIPRIIQDNRRIHPSTYLLNIEQPGYTFGKPKKIVVEKSDSPYLIQEKLLAKPRTLSFDFIDSKITDSKFEKIVKAEEVVVNGKLAKWEDKYNVGTKVTINVKFKDYEDVVMDTTIVPGEGPMIVRPDLIRRPGVEIKPVVSLLRTVHIKIDYDFAPPSDYPEYVVILVDKEKGYPRSIISGGKIFPTTYLMSIEQPGYTFGKPKEIVIDQGDTPYLIHEKLFAKPRTLSFDFIDQTTQMMVQAEQIVADGKPVHHDDRFKVGAKVAIIVKFKDYEDVSMEIAIVPGEGPLVVRTDLKKRTGDK